MIQVSMRVRYNETDWKGYTRRHYAFTDYVNTDDAVKAINRALENLPSGAVPYQVTAKQIAVLELDA